MSLSFVKWAGGKVKLLKDIDEVLPSEINNYVEPFVGGGSVLFHVLRTKKPTGRVVAIDVNRHLVNAYKCLQQVPDELVRSCEHLETLYNGAGPGKQRPCDGILLEDAAAAGKETMYYYIRKLYNRTVVNNHTEAVSCERAAWFLFLNKTGFRGLYRENSKGEFNVPFGNYSQVNILPHELALKWSTELQGVEFIHADAISWLESKTHEDTTVYADPPYVAWGDDGKENIFSDYVGSGFNVTKTCKLISILDKIAVESHATRVILSNAPSAGITDLLCDGWHTRVLEARRAIKSRGKHDKKPCELLAYK